MINPDVIIIGAGASGMAAAVKAAERNKNILVLEKNDRPGRKILASGNGRCNLMNEGHLRYYGDNGFVHTIMKKIPVGSLKTFFGTYGLLLASEEQGRIYPVSFQSSSVVSVLKNAMDANNVKIRTGITVDSVSVKKGLFSVKDMDGNIWESEKLIISCGSSACPKLGGTDSGYDILRSVGHSIVPVVPALVPLTTDKKSISGLSGIRARCRVYLYEDKTLLHSEEGEILFTDYGISGICVMQCARFTNGKRTHMDIDFMYGIFDNPDRLLAELKRRREIYGKRSPVCLLDGILADHIAYAVMKQAGIRLRGEKAGDLSDFELKNVAQTAFCYKVSISGTRGMEYAQVAAGGADCSEFNPETMESLIVPGLFATGEILNVDGDCGGFNLMFAFSTGLLAGISV